MINYRPTKEEDMNYYRIEFGDVEVLTYNEYIGAVKGGME